MTFIGFAWVFYHFLPKVVSGDLRTLCFVDRSGEGEWSWSRLGYVNRA